MADMVAFARAPDRLGYDFLTCPDHVAVPRGVARGEHSLEHHLEQLAAYAEIVGLDALG